MHGIDHDRTFPVLNPAYNRVFRPGQMSLGLVLPIEAYAVGAEPTMEGHLETARLAERLGFSAIWLRDVPFNVPSFGDVGQIFDPFVYLGSLAVATETIALGVASVILPLRHPAHVAKASASADVLSGGRLLLGVASGDRPEEYPAMSRTFPDRGARFRESFEYVRSAAQSYPHLKNSLGAISGDIDLLPKPVGGRLPMLITGGSQQTPDWIARHGDGWMTYPRDVPSQGRLITDYRNRTAAEGLPDKPVMQSLYIDLVDHEDANPQPIHLGFRSGVGFLRHYLAELAAVGVNHVAINLRFNRIDIDTTLKRLADEVLSKFSH